MNLFTADTAVLESIPSPFLLNSLTRAKLNTTGNTSTFADGSKSSGNKDLAASAIDPSDTPNFS